MDYDLLLRGGRVVDGSGLPGYQADVGVRDGTIVEIGRLRGTAARALDEQLLSGRHCAAPPPAIVRGG